MNINSQHLEEFQASAIAEDIAALNFRSFDGEDETELEEIFTLLIPAPKHNNNGTLSGKSQNKLAGILRSGGWIFEGFKGICVKPNSPRTDETKGKPIKYESPRGVGSQQLFIPKASVRAGLAIATKLGSIAPQQYLDRVGTLDLKLEDKEFWSWFESTLFPLMITEGPKNAAALISAGYPAIALSGFWGWGKNVKDVYEEVEKGDDGRSLKDIHPDLEILLNGREIVFALDRDVNPLTAKMVKNAKSVFVREIEGEGILVTDLKWRSPKGIDDYIAAKGEAGLDRIYASRKKIEPAPDKRGLGKESKKSLDTPEKDYKSLAQRLGFNEIAVDGDGVVSSKLNRFILDLFELTGDALKLNLMSREYELEGKPVDINNARTFISENLNVLASTEDCISAIHRIANQYAYHPVQEYLESLKGNVVVDFSVLENIATHFLGNPDPLANKMMAKKLVAAVARVMQPGCKDDTLLVLQGKQGVGKSTFLNVLAGNDWFCDDIRDLDDKDELAKLSRNWILELAEVDYLMGRKEVESFKRFLSTKSDTYRPPYGRANIQIDRACSFFATTNKTEFLIDPTGDRRYWVVEVNGKIDCAQVAAYRDTIWATALAAYERGDTWYLDGEDEAERSDSHSKYRDSDPWVAVILGIDGKLPTTPHSTGEYTLTDRIFDRLELTAFQRGRRESNRVKTAMLELGFEYKVLWLAGKAQKAWYRDLPLPNNSPLPNNNLLGKACNSVGEPALLNLPNLPNIYKVVNKEAIDVPQLENINIEITPIQELLGNVSKLGKSGTEKHLQALPNNNLLGKRELLGKELAGKDFKIGDRVSYERIDKTGSIKDVHTKKTPKGSEYTEYLVDFGFDNCWLEALVLNLEVA